ncbi:MAG TPA: aspartate 1-decarboxylase [Candidatus Thiothrix moscowensis]|uniref:aspartate 1-decarboxylase n=1 Tax=unclassified Thiothrix TaxID=2636184 RepID=UPI001A1EEABA|nr:MULTISPECIES: aspartate 1-decarboxylase [unclassified Thiothrix]MBJ6610886.1 aspartate 1-decarboxylase [Candidatus Thiothrix moscowensis]HRJ53873.1 aspartate 1-decarboxylase [Candidatus Thiothrix moscowensis]HRJ93955.1 aspartate 1-decarboxylase [Candidatus Thiothrix moscowensis]
MELTLLKSKLHRVTVTHAELDYEGSCAIDDNFLRIGNIREYEQLHIYNITNGERFSTYAIRAEAGSGVISINGAAAHKAKTGDLLIICTYANFSEAEANLHKPELVYFDRQNRVTHTSRQIAVQAA